MIPQKLTWTESIFYNSFWDGVSKLGIQNAIPSDRNNIISFLKEFLIAETLKKWKSTLHPSPFKLQYNDLGVKTDSNNFVDEYARVPDSLCKALLATLHYVRDRVAAQFTSSMLCFTVGTLI